MATLLAVVADAVDSTCNDGISYASVVEEQQHKERISPRLTNKIRIVLVTLLQESLLADFLSS